MNRDDKTAFLIVGAILLLCIIHYDFDKLSSLNLNPSPDNLQIVIQFLIVEIAKYVVLPLFIVAIFYRLVWER